MDFEKLINERYSVRSFKAAEVEQEKLNKILNAGRIAPTARNSQPQRFRVLNSSEALAKLDECTPCRFGAPLAILICYDTAKAVVNNYKISLGEMDASIAITHMMLQAWELGIGSCWVRHFDLEKTKELFNIPKSLVPITFLMLGFANDKTSVNHGKRMPLEDFMF